MATNTDKAKQLVQKATGTFTKAIAEVEKANDLLLKDIVKDNIEMERITKEIENLYSKLDVVQAEKLDKKAGIIQNKELIAKLEKFTKV